VRVLVVNAGSSSLKVSLVEPDGETPLAESVPLEDGRPERERLGALLARAGRVDAVGHRVVHGGVEFSAAVLLDAGVLSRLRALSDLAPLHQPRALAAAELCAELLPDVPAVACFDTAFHATLPAAASTYALPAEWRARWPIRRFGFHGLSHAYASRRAAELLGREAAPPRVVTCHLGAGASLAAVQGGVSVDTTMGFTPLEGLVMATRSGSVDPGLLLWLEQHAGLAPSELADALEQRSGLLGLAGTGDMRELLAAAAAGEPAAALALAVYLHRLRGAIASMAAAMGGLDALVFTGGVGEHAPEVRAGAADGLGFLGVSIDAARNAGARPDTDLSDGAARVRTLLLEAREDLQIAREVRALLGSGAEQA
jgi:acetate kinase